MNKMYEYLLEHNYISENKKSNYQSELSIERAECISNKSNSLIEEEKEQLIKYLEDKINNINLLTSRNKSLGISIVILAKLQIYKEILEKIRSGNYED